MRVRDRGETSFDRPLMGIVDEDFQNPVEVAITDEVEVCDVEFESSRQCYTYPAVVFVVNGDTYVNAEWVYFTGKRI